MYTVPIVVRVVVVHCFDLDSLQWL